MITPVVKNPTTVVIGPCRLSYTHLLQKWSPDGDPANGKYMTNILIPKEEKETLKAVMNAVENAKKASIDLKWKGKEPKKLEMPLRDGADKDDEVYDGHYYLNAKCSNRPGVIDSKKNPIIDEEEIYSGIWALVSITFYGYDVSGNKGVACGLNNVMKVRDGERLGGRNSAENDFAGIDPEGEDEDIL